MKKPKPKKKVAAKPPANPINLEHVDELVSTAMGAILAMHDIARRLAVQQEAGK
jgi:hypothetical protein